MKKGGGKNSFLKFPGSLLTFRKSWTVIKVRVTPLDFELWDWKLESDPLTSGV